MGLKEIKFFYYLAGFLKAITPKVFYTAALQRWLNHPIQNIPEFQERLSYYISADIHQHTGKQWLSIKEYKKPKKGSMYYIDMLSYIKYFPKHLKINYHFGDVNEDYGDANENFSSPTFVKSRPINHNGNAVLLKLNAYRHFKFINDTKHYQDKKDGIVWRGVIHKENRRELVRKFHNHPLCNIGEVSPFENKIEAWQKDYLTIQQQLDYKFILSVEGVDVATNLKWIMSSNSLCFMPKPKYETWFMEGKLIPNHHYVLIEVDYSNLLEKRDYYSKNEAEALAIIKNANQWVAQFQNKTLEKALGIHVLHQFFTQTHQKL